MVHPDTYIKQTSKGLGIFAKRKFYYGEILWIADDFDVRISLQAYQNLDPIQKARFNIYSYMDCDKKVIIPWDEGKYVNHSCDPNSTSLLQYDNISVAIRDIEKDDEIVEDYYSYFAHFETFVCNCGAANCRHRIKRDDSYDAGLRLDLQDVAPVILSRHQVLLDVENKETRLLRTFLQSFDEKHGKMRKQA